MRPITGEAWGDMGSGGPAGEFRRSYISALLLLPALFAVAASGTEPEAARPRLVVLAVDGAGHSMVGGLLREGALPAFARLQDRGALSDGMTPLTPPRTAPSFAAIWTGQPGRANGVTGNSVLRVPPESHSLLDVESGFDAGVLRVEPLWIRAAKAGRRSVLLHVTHTAPVGEAVSGLSPVERDRIAILTGYEGVREAPVVLDENSAPLFAAASRPELASLPEADGGAAAFRFSVGETGFIGLFFNDPAVPGDPRDPTGRSGWNTFAVLDDPPGAPPLFLARIRVGAGGEFSGPISARSGGASLRFTARAFAARPGDSGSLARYVAYRSGAHEVGIHPEALWRDRLGPPAFQGFVGAASHASGALGVPATRGGEGLAEERLVEIVRQFGSAVGRQLEAALSVPDWDLLVLYVPFVDEVGHMFYGRLDERLGSFDPAIAGRLRPVLTAALGEADRLLGRILDGPGAEGAHVMVLADHGMAAVESVAHVNTALEQAGFLAWGDDGRPDLAATRAMYLTTGDGGVAVNRASRPGGVVPDAEAPTVLASVRAALAALRTPEGEPVFTGFIEPVGAGVFPAGGPSTGDLFPAPGPGIRMSARRSEEVLTSVEPSGDHGFAPTRRDMWAVLGAAGPRIEPGTRWPRASVLDVLPTVLDLLEMPTDPRLPGRSLLGPRPLAPPTRDRARGTEAARLR